jgi:predicted MPP superfamily phosphohydrolase
MESKCKIINGPYLLDPAAGGVTVAWEMEEKTAAHVDYGNDFEKTIEAEAQREPGCLEHPAGCVIYTARLDGLAGKDCRYRIKAGQELLAEDVFPVLAAHPDRVHLVTLSDSHLFHTEKQFTAMIAREKPDFMLHGGDISFGTGYQHEQYTDNWFQKIPGVLRRVPAYYIQGNHDDGPFYQAFFAAAQARSVHTADGGNTFSFDYGMVHFTLVNSNPWGLFEMNAVNSGLSVDEGTRKQIESTLAWVEDDLRSPAARAAKWRVLLLHHPYTDDFNNRYIVPLAERCGVELVLGGHLHYYVKAVSVNPAVGARTVYACEGSTQDAEASLEVGSVEKRLLHDFPEVVGMGKTNYGVLDATDDELCYRLYGFTAYGQDRLVDTIRLTKAEPEVEFSGIKLSRLDNEGRIEIAAVAENVGRSMAAAVLELWDNSTVHSINLFGSAEASQVIVLEPGEKRKVTAVYRAAGPGMHDIRVAEATLQLQVFEATKMEYEHMRLARGTGTAADCLMAKVEATNNLDREVLAAVPLYIDRQMVASSEALFRPHEKKQIEFCHRFQRGGSYQVSIADQLPQEIEIEGGIRIVPRIKDRSGRGHDALLQGTPKVIVTDKQAEVVLEHYGDYIEIPASRDLIAEQGFSSMVWAKVERLAKAEEMGHNPLMVRGRSVGWGATYLLRMVIERAGGLKWGICHDITEYSWQGGQAKIGAWAHYAMTFDKAAGGDSYCDGMKLAHVQGIGDDDKLRQWEEEPLFIGYSYIGHIIPEIGRPKYFTHLPARISQVRFYTSRLSEEENRRLTECPQAAGPQAEDMAVWLDFRQIMTTGTHTTEWRHPVVLAPAFKTEKDYWHFKQLKARTVLSARSSLRAEVQVSDDGMSIKAAKTIVLQNGTEYIDMAELPPAQYLRIVTGFKAEVGPEGTFIPELQEYQVAASQGSSFADMVWSTRPDWERGTFTGAVGFAPVDRLRSYPEYTDVIHG